MLQRCGTLQNNRRLLEDKLPIVAILVIWARGRRKKKKYNNQSISNQVIKITKCSELQRIYCGQRIVGQGLLPLVPSS